MDIKAIRTALGLSQEELAHKIGVVGMTVHRWETGKAIPHKMFRKQLAKIEAEISKTQAQ